MREKTFFEQLEEAGDENDVRRRLAEGLYSPRHASMANEWLAGRERERKDEAYSRKEVREVAGLDIARNALENSSKALENSKLATRIAILALVLTIILAGHTIWDWYRHNP